jgi:hypothetical protein
MDIRIQYREVDAEHLGADDDDGDAIAACYNSIIEERILEQVRGLEQVPQEASVWVRGTSETWADSEDGYVSGTGSSVTVTDADGEGWNGWCERHKLEELIADTISYVTAESQHDAILGEALERCEEGVDGL